MMRKLRKIKKDNKGFTLVELIVILVILAILAALTVPALLGWIDEANQKQYQLEARSVYLAAQSKASELYGKGSDIDTDAELKTGLTGVATKIENMADVTALTIDSVTSQGEGNTKSQFTIKTIKVTFTSADSTIITAELEDDAWTITTP